jgi:hypothetical protein
VIRISSAWQHFTANFFDQRRVVGITLGYGSLPHQRRPQRHPARFAPLRRRIKRTVVLSVDEWEGVLLPVARKFEPGSLTDLGSYPVLPAVIRFTFTGGWPAVSHPAFQNVLANVNAAALTAFEKSLILQLFVGKYDRIPGYANLLGEFARGRQPLPGGKLPEIMPSTIFCRIWFCRLRPESESR